MPTPVSVSGGFGSGAASLVLSMAGSSDGPEGAMGGAAAGGQHAESATAGGSTGPRRRRGPFESAEPPEDKSKPAMGEPGSGYVYRPGVMPDERSDEQKLRDAHAVSVRALSLGSVGAMPGSNCNILWNLRWLKICENGIAGWIGASV